MVLILVTFITWGEKIGQWNNQSGFLDILEGNPKILFFIKI